MELTNFKRSALIENRWLTLFEDSYDLPNGVSCTYYHAHQNDAVMAIAVEKHGNDTLTYIVNQYRHPIGQSIWQFPLGGFDPKTEDACDVAKMELLEETGVVVDTMECVGSFYANPGFTNQRIHVCISSNITQKSSARLEATEFGLISKKVPLSEIAGMISSGDMGDAWGITGLFYLNLFVSEMV